MPYASNADLPPSVRRHLPEHAHAIFREAFNHAFAAHADDPRREEAAHRIAWGAVKRSYVKVGTTGWPATSDSAPGREDERSAGPRTSPRRAAEGAGQTILI
jgi:cation transport regulator